VEFMMGAVDKSVMKLEDDLTLTVLAAQFGELVDEEILHSHERTDD
jgi:hypothetical protein